MELNEKIKYLRAEKKMTQTQLAHLLQVSQDTVSLWEVGKSLPDITILRKLTAIFDVSADYLLGLTEI